MYVDISIILFFDFAFRAMMNNIAGGIGIIFVCLPKMNVVAMGIFPRRAVA
jgi:hypothetical protein